MKRQASVIALKPDRIEEYLQLHRQVWPRVLQILRDHHVRNYSIFFRRVGGEPLLFSYLEYTGDDFDADMARVAGDPVTQEWWALCKPCHEPLPDRQEGEWWAGMEEAFHVD